MAFDITKALGDIGRRPDDTEAEGRRELRYIPLRMIDRNPKNFYSTEGIDELAENIRLFGLMEPLIVRQQPSGRYTLVSGHRRRLALRKLAEEKNSPDAMSEPVACLVEPEDAPLPGIEPGGANEIIARHLADELKLIYANADTRVMSSADTAQQVKRIRELFSELQDLGYKFPGKMRDHVAAAAKVSATRVARLDVIEKGLTEPTLRKAWKDGTIGETTAYEIARRSPEAQHAAAAFTGPDALQKMTTEQVVVTMDYYASRAEEDRRANEEWNRNVGTMAKATKDAEPAKNVKSDFSADEYLKQRRREDDTFAERLSELFDMFVKDKDWDYVTDRREGIEFLKRKHGGTSHGGSTETGFFDCSLKGLTLADDDYEDAITRTWTEVFDELSLGALRMVARGKVSAADTGTQWQTGNPKEVGGYVVIYGVGVEENQATRSIGFMNWNGENWVSLKNGTPIKDGKTVYRWVKLPEV